MLVPVPVEVAPPGERVRVQVPEAGRPLSATLPVATAQVGCVMAPMEGADGVEGCALMVTPEEETEVQPVDWLVTVQV